MFEARLASLMVWAFPEKGAPSMIIIRPDIVGPDNAIPPGVLT
jgi:hypothetical protein